MSVELYPNIEDLAERLSVLEDPELAARIATANPQLFGSAAAQEEVSIFAVAWKRFGALALAVTAALAVGAGFAFAPHTAAQPAHKPVAGRVAVHEKEKVRPKVTALRLNPPRRHVVVARPAATTIAAAPAAVIVPVAAPVHHTVAYHQPAAAHAIAAAAAHAVAAPQGEAPLQYEANTQIVSGNVPPTDSIASGYTKTVPVAANNDASIAPIPDSCTPTGGRLSYLIKN